MGSFRHVDEETVHEGHIIRVVVGTFAGPSGDEFQRDVIRHPGAVAVLPLHDDGTVTLVRQYRAPIDDLLLEIPAGIRDVEDEPTEVTAARELAEEVGLEADAYEHLVAFHNAPGCRTRSCTCTWPPGCARSARRRRAPRRRPCPSSATTSTTWPAMIGDGRLTDAKTVIAVALVRAR